MKKVKVLTGYFDTQLGRHVTKNEVFEVDDERAKVLLEHYLNPVEVIEIEEEIDDIIYDLTPPLKTPEELRKSLKPKAKKVVKKKKSK